jgi:hypothetical protein
LRQDFNWKMKKWADFINKSGNIIQKDILYWKIFNNVFLHSWNGFLVVLFLPQVWFDPLYRSNQVVGWKFANNHTKALILNHPHMLDVVNTKTKLWCILWLNMTKMPF